MSIRFPVELAAAAEYAESAVDVVPAPAVPAIRFADATFDLGLAGEPIRIALGPGFNAGPTRKLIPGQTYH
ncbi:MAG TPA: hypothetical protein VFK86_10705 [Bauldia sp.]|nr:hypothetical protein [Bauldia sp.]